MEKEIIRVTALTPKNGEKKVSIVKLLASLPLASKKGRRIVKQIILLCSFFLLQKKKTENQLRYSFRHAPSIH